ncbi:hypothetical protein E2C01_024037 [Portunus trituberculatus]|uniref:Uncharacterized protein n=1 Tax=Portunus trituberculatus TaxID=210409 RepID=A0A5B7EAV2_PORTR|nr:hypothetical protein [Portunus trituberculatus]
MLQSLPPSLPPALSTRQSKALLPSPPPFLCISTSVSARPPSSPESSKPTNTLTQTNKEQS